MVETIPTVIFDNGAYTVKIGLSTQNEPHIMPNCIMKAKAERRRAFIGDQIEDCRDASGLFYVMCFQKGYLLNWDIQKTVWDYVFSDEGSGICLEDHNILITEPQFNFDSIQEAMVEILFEEYQCGGIYKTTTAEIAIHNYNNEENKGNSLNNLNCLIVEVGYSFTHIIPFVRGQKVSKGIRRVEIGGKALTNHLKELISYRHLNMMDESYVVNQIKEDVCFVSKNFMDDMRVHKNNKKRSEIIVDYVLPDFTTVKRGYIRRNDLNEKSEETIMNNNDQQFVRLCNERFTVPELLFNPSDIGIDQMGIPEAIMDALKDCPTFSHYQILRNILIIGGSSLFPGFKERLQIELRALAPDDYEVNILLPEDPISYGWYGGKLLANSDLFKENLLSRSYYEENGYNPGNCT